MGVTLGPLLTIAWNQSWPYNYYAPVASGGPGGRAYAGCVATAMSMILRYHQWPVAITTNYSYYDGGGVCVGTHAASDATLNAYQWGSMPASISSGSATAQKQAVGQLMYHCGVTVNMDFE
ncbi:MAG: C10 family peptidase, partial [bacterium]|nr:C10 family peptidase [bacterium]